MYYGSAKPGALQGRESGRNLTKKKAVRDGTASSWCKDDAALVQRRHCLRSGRCDLFVRLSRFLLAQAALDQLGCARLCPNGRNLILGVVGREAFDD